MNLRLFALLMIIISCCGTIGAQQTLLTSGGNASGTGGSASYSVGQIAYTYAEGSAGSLSAGVQQTYEIIEVTGIAETDEMLISVFPSQVTSFLSLVTETDNFKVLKFRLFDLNGKMIRSGKIKDRLTKIYVGDLVRSTYLIEIYDGNIKSRSYKFIKN